MKISKKSLSIQSDLHLKCIGLYKSHPTFWHEYLTHIKEGNFRFFTCGKIIPNKQKALLINIFNMGLGPYFYTLIKQYKDKIYLRFDYKPFEDGLFDYCVTLKTDK